MSFIVCFLSVYGMFYLLYNISLKVAKHSKVKAKYLHHVIAVDDNSDNIEAYIRTLSAQKEEDVIIINLASDEEINHIISILQAEKSFLKVFSPEEYKNYIDLRS